jgi:hypothetical protein
MDAADGSVNDIAAKAAELGLTADPRDLDALRSEIKTRISESHPDHKSGHEDDRLQQLTALLQATGTQSKSLSSPAQSTELSTTVNPTAPLVREHVETRIEEVRASYQKMAGRGFLVPKLSLTGVTAALAWVFAFPKSLKDHPYMGRLIGTPYAIDIWGGAVVVLGLAWLLVWYMEGKKKQLVDRLLSLSVQRAALENIGKTDGTAFSASQFQEVLYPAHVWWPTGLRKMFHMFMRKKIYYYANPSYDQTLADKVTELALERFVNKGWIIRTSRPEDEKGIDDWYKFT